MRRSRPTRLAWSLGIAAIAMIVGSIVLMYLDRHVPLPSSESQWIWNFSNVLGAVVNIAVPAIGIVLASRRPENPIGWMFVTAGFFLGVAAIGMTYGLHALVARHGTLPGGNLGAWASNALGFLPLIILALLFLLFPTGRLPAGRWRLGAWVIGISAAILSIENFISATINWNKPFSSAGGGPAVFQVVGFLLPFVLLLLTSLAAVVMRYRRSVGDERLQLKWFATGAALVVASFFASFFGSPSASSSPPAIISILQSAAFLLLWGAIAVAVLKYRLYEIDVVISRAVVYGTLAVFITLVYIALVVGVGTLVGNRSSPVLSAIAAAVVAVAFQPIRLRAGRLANRIVYRKRATPYEVLSDFAERMAGTYSVDEILPRTARMLAEGMGAVRADVWLVVGAELRAAGSWPASGTERIALPANGSVAARADGTVDVPGSSRAVPVRFQGDLLGALSVEKAPGDPMTATDEKLLADVASQAGLVLHNVRLIEDLRASRQRIVTAQDQARRRLERNIHDGAQQQLVALAVKLNVAGALVGRDTQKERAIIDELKTEIADALETLRDLARGIYPPLLADQGLAAALQSQARKVPVPVTVDADGVGRYSQDVEAAVYFCALEALQNIAKYAQATEIVIRLWTEHGAVRFEVRDDGVGFDPAMNRPGTGLQGMADRLAALGGTLDIRSSPGGGTTVSGQLPAAAAPDGSPRVGA